MASKCPKCKLGIDTNLNYDCPKCGEKFWQTKEAFEKAIENRFIYRHPTLPYLTSDTPFSLDEVDKIEDKQPTDNRNSFQLVGNNDKKIKYPIEWYNRLFISPGFSEYFTKGFVSAVLLNVLGFSIGLQFSENTGNRIIWTSWIIMLVYWLAITIGYVYGNYKYRDYRLKKIHHNKVYTNKIFCPKCGKKIDDDSNYCIFCSAKIIKAEPK